MIEELKVAIMDRAKATSFWADIGTRLTFTQAIQEETYPYAVYGFSGFERDEIMGTKDDGMILADVQFALVEQKDDGGVSIGELHDSLRSAFDWCTLSIEGYSHIAFEPVNVLPMTYDDTPGKKHSGGIWQVISIYSVRIEKE